MIQGLLWVGLITLTFGLASSRLQGEMGPFATTHVVVGGVALLAFLVLSLRDLGQRTRNPSASGTLRDSLLRVFAVAWAVVLLQGFVTLSQWRVDWTFEGHGTLAPATCKAVNDLTLPPRLTLYTDTGDPRTRRTRQFLEEVARCRTGVRIDQKEIDLYPEEEDRFAIGSSNTVVIQSGDLFETVQRPTEGAIFEALSILNDTVQGTLYFTVGSGEGNATRSNDLGYSGLAAALETEGYRLGTLVTASVSEIPKDAAAVISIAPERPLRPEAVAAIKRYLERDGGSLVAFLAPCRTSGLEALLGEFGLTSPDAVVVDPASGPVDGEAPGLNPLAFSYEQHPGTRGLNSNRMTFFGRSRSFTLRKVRPEDVINATVYASSRSWMHEEPCTVSGRVAPQKPEDVRTDYHPLVVTGEFERGNHQARIAAFGNASMASNRYLRTLYNLDLVMNTIHWAVAREPAITLRPKTGGTLQFPVPLQNSMTAFYGVGLLVPELLLLIGGLIWLKRRSA